MASLILGEFYELHAAATSIIKHVQKRRKQPQPLPGIQLLSDLHLEIGQQYTSFTVPTAAPYLVLAGDIGKLVDYDGYLQFLQQLVPHYTKVFLVLGNHEFYSVDYETGMERARSLEKEPSLEGKVLLLQQARWDDPDSKLTILGCTLWSSVPEASQDSVRLRVSDFQQISGWTIEKHNQLHAEDADWLREQVRQCNGQPGNERDIVIATHHAPCLKGTSSPEHDASPVSSAFATELLATGSWKGVRAWIFGHTHYSTDFVRKGIRVVANQRGYVLPNGQALEMPSTRGRKAREFDPQMVIFGDAATQ